jgi:hypothetical protein
MLPHTPVTFKPEQKRLPQGTARRDIYELPGDDDCVVSGPATELPITQGRTKPNANKPVGEPRTSSFRYPDSSSSPETQESRTVEKCLEISRQHPQIDPKTAVKTPSNPVQTAPCCKYSEEVFKEAPEPLHLEQ